ncbi:hypothetical protein T492DRAFT_972681 [Pavlovales sp. CCMP2436]|nr:hypothetical protein T492DRAFT_972681 [Pavlovales sp. CCMP2436]|mmetsp:Transcript_12303/g.31037  ORF Transcript_12303/g.31037 Transcript_12303/m.31037 type:complete len:266 (+) Transcript_12303:104-901(+)
MASPDSRLLDELFERLFFGDAETGELCTLVDQIGAQPTLELSEAERKLLAAWPREVALAGIYRDLPATSSVDDALYDAFHAQKDRARGDFHRRLQAKLESRLQMLYSQAAPLAGSLEHKRALGRLRAFGAAHALPAAPLLSGLRAALRFQARSDARTVVLWVMDDAALLNVGFAHIGEAVSVLRAVGMWLCDTSPLLEGGDLHRTQRCWSLLPGVWSRAQARALAVAVRDNPSVAPTGIRVTTPLGPDEPAVLGPDRFLGWCEVL